MRLSILHSPLPTLTLLLAGILLLPATKVHALEVKGEVSAEGTLFFDDGAWPGQGNESASLAGNIELHHDFTDRLSFTLEGFYRLDSLDRERTHGDLRQARLLYFNDILEISAGVGRVFWGATEFVHLVDIINQTDQVEKLDGEEKLGQPMLHLTVPREWGVLETFVLPWFRERTFPGERGRFRSPLPVDTDAVVYESGSEEQHIDMALRYSTSLANGDIGLSWFKGTARDPALLLARDKGETPSLYPYYQQISQTALDLQMTAAEWLLKGEAYYRTGQSRSYAATTFGFEYTVTGLAESMMDLGLITEYVYDDRDDGWLPTVYGNDIMAGLRLTVNDLDDSNVLLGVIRDLDTGSTIITLEASRRLGESIRLNLEGSLFLDMDRRDPAAAMARDDFLRLELIYYW